MRAYNIAAAEGSVKDTLKELQIILDFQLSEEGCPVEISKEGKGIFLKKDGDRHVLHYSAEGELARAWFLLLRMEEKEEYEYRETCRFENLEVMLDCSRNAVMRPETLKEYIRMLAACGYNALQLYTEDTIKVSGEPYFGYMRGAYTEEELHEVDEYAKKFGIELIPCIQTLAHINQITRYDQYKKIVDINDILLVDEEGTYELLEHVIASAARAYSSRKINIGMDEAHMLGLGKYLDEHGYQERYQIMIRHLKRVMEILNRYGFRPMMWSDMFFRLLSKGAYTIQEDQVDEELFQMIPKDVELVYWDYYSMDYTHYYENLKMHRRMSPNVGFAAGAWKWTGFAPENGYSLRAGQQSMKACLDSGIKDFIVTCWGDNGAEASAFSVLPCLFRYAEAAYRGCSVEVDNTEEMELSDQAFRVLTGLTFEEFMKADSPNQIFHKTEHCHANPCKYLLYNDVLIGTFDSLVTEDAKEEYLQKQTELEKLVKSGSRYAYIFETLAKLCAVLSIKADMGIRIYRNYQDKNITEMRKIAEDEIPELLHRIEEFQESFSRQWHRDNKALGFEIQLIRLGGLKERLVYAQRQILLWLEGGKDRVEELEEKRLPFAYVAVTDASEANVNVWSTIVSPGVIG